MNWAGFDLWYWKRQELYGASLFGTSNFGTDLPPQQPSTYVPLLESITYQVLLSFGAAFHYLTTLAGLQRSPMPPIPPRRSTYVAAKQPLRPFHRLAPKLLLSFARRERRCPRQM